MKIIIYIFLMMITQKLVISGDSSDLFILINGESDSSIAKDFMERKSLERPIILVIDDDTSIRKVLERFFLKRNYAVVFFADGQCFLDFLREQGIEYFEHIKGIIIDNNMPKILGKDVIKIIHDENLFTVRTTNNQQGIPLLFNTSDDSSLFESKVLTNITFKLSTKNNLKEITAALAIAE